MKYIIGIGLFLVLVIVVASAVAGTAAGALQVAKDSGAGQAETIQMVQSAGKPDGSAQSDLIYSQVNEHNALANQANKTGDAAITNSATGMIHELGALAGQIAWIFVGLVGLLIFFAVVSKGSSGPDADE